MNIILSPNRTLNSIAEEFNHKFPYLKLKFFSQLHEAGSLTSDLYRLNGDMTLQEVGQFKHTETLHIDGHMKVATFESKFQKLFGIGVQVLRRSGGLWLQTSATDEWTFSKQNREGEMDSMPIMN